LSRRRYGLGQILIKQEKYGEALAHFEMACRINPASSVLRCCCGLALNKMGRLDEAVRQLKVRATATSLLSLHGAFCAAALQNGQFACSVGRRMAQMPAVAVTPVWHCVASLAVC
jgi:tetratricopeptide (TPR) repeat protein